MTLEMVDEKRYLPWPDSASVVITSKSYKTPDGELARVTRPLKVLGLGTDPLIKWAANSERTAVLEAAGEAFAAGGHEGPQEFINAVEQRIGSARQHQRLIAQAADIGTAIHQAIHDFLKVELGLPSPPTTGLSDPALWAVMAFQDWWKQANLKPVRMEQVVWDAREGYAGTIDLVAEHPEEGMGVVDFKSSRFIYDEHHIQVAAYLHAGRNYADLRWARIVRVPKNTSDPAFEVRDLGQLYGRKVTEAQLMDCFRAALTVYKTLVAT